MAGGGSKKSNEFVICEGCNKNVAVTLIATHTCSVDAKVAETQSEDKKSWAPPTAFYIFMNDFRKTYEKENPYVNLKDVKTVPKLGGEKWKSFTDDEKKVYRDSAAQLANMSLKSTDSEEEEEYEMRELMIAKKKNKRR